MHKSLFFARKARTARLCAAVSAALLIAALGTLTARIGAASPARTSPVSSAVRASGARLGDLGARRAVALYTFSGPDGAIPSGGLVGDKAGVLYGVTQRGGANNLGTVFKLAPPPPGQSTWTITTLHAFIAHNEIEGYSPNGPLARDAAGTLYGTTALGGSCTGCGTVFKLSPPAPGKSTWTETVLHDFPSGNIDGTSPNAGVVLDSSGAVYGTAQYGGSCDECGIVFKLTPPQSGQTGWTETVIHSFTGISGDGREPKSTLALGADGTLYGTTAYGGAGDAGIVYELTPPAPGKTTWTETVLHAFAGLSDPDGSVPFAGVVLDGRGALTGATYAGGLSNCKPYGCGSVYRLDPPAPGQSVWSIDVLYAFTGVNYGASPTSNATIDRMGSLFGMTTTAAFRLTPPPGGQGAWTPSLVHAFTAGDVGGRSPSGTLIEDRHGNLYGTASSGGNTTSCSEGGSGCGVVFELLK